MDGQRSREGFIKGGLLANLSWFAVLSSVVALASGCTTWQAASGSLESIVAAPSPPSVRVVLDDGQRLVIPNPTIRGDTLIGQNEQTRVSVPKDHVRGVETRRLHLLGTAAAVLFLPAAAIVMALLMMALS